MKTQLDKQQSQHLIELGFPKWKVQEIKPSDVSLKDWEPTITLTELLEILPKEITVSGFKLPLLIEFEEKLTHAHYYCYEGCNFLKEELIDSLYELCVWTIENGYLKFE